MRELGIITDGAVLIVNGIIAQAGPSRRVENLAEAKGAIEINATGRVVMPGFVDSHTHLIAGASRPDSYHPQKAAAKASGFPGDVLGGELLTAVRAVRGMTARSLEFQARKIVEGCIRHGTTTLEAKSGYGLDETTELRILRVLAGLNQRPIQVVPTYLGAYVTPPEFERRCDDYIEWMCSEMMPKIKRRKLAEFADVRCGPDGFDLAQSSKYLQAAKRLGFIPKVHAEGTCHSDSIRMAVGLQAASVDGLNCASEEDAAILARSSTIATLMPGSTFQGLHDRYPPARMLLDHGAAVALASGFHHVASPSYNMQTVLALACSAMKMSPAEAITAATINGAYAVCRAARVGSLQFGKEADLIMLAVPDYREIPYYFGVNLVAMTMRRGEIVYKEADVSWKEELSSV
jgi:imidazolonepropionase